jgi:hypothetical protein
MDECFEYFLENFGPQFEKVQPSSGGIEKFRGKLPDKLLEYWLDYGWGGFHNGLFWLVNPDDYVDLVTSWLDGRIIDSQDYYVIARTAFGKIFLWNKANGQTVTVSPLFSEIITRPPNKAVLAGDDATALEAFLAAKEPDSLDIEDEKEKKLFKRVLKKFGVLNSNEMYAFEPALAIGGMPKLENVVKVDIMVHLALLEQLSDVEIRHMDVSRHL